VEFRLVIGRLGRKERIANPTRASSVVLAQVGEGMENLLRSFPHMQERARRSVRCTAADRSGALQHEVGK
jgi:hypothetical protein